MSKEIFGILIKTRNFINMHYK